MQLCDLLTFGISILTTKFTYSTSYYDGIMLPALINLHTQTHIHTHAQTHTHTDTHTDTDTDTETHTQTHRHTYRHRDT